MARRRRRDGTSRWERWRFHLRVWEASVSTTGLFRRFLLCNACCRAWEVCPFNDDDGKPRSAAPPLWLTAALQRPSSRVAGLTRYHCPPYRCTRIHDPRRASPTRNARRSTICSTTSTEAVPAHLGRSVLFCSSTCSVLRGSERERSRRETSESWRPTSSWRRVSVCSVLMSYRLQLDVSSALYRLGDLEKPFAGGSFLRRADSFGDG